MLGVGAARGSWAGGSSSPGVKRDLSPTILAVLLSKTFLRILSTQTVAARRSVGAGTSYGRVRRERGAVGCLPRPCSSCMHS